ncbi:MAG: O-acetyl-ADP-ribose deacetylase [Lachnospiraceae bacterium]|nr:O-acetyl-ADP-ribose deacetylase [Lachnospiraceae bacterium]
MIKTLIKTVKGDITKITDVQAIVNAANSSLLGGGGVDGAIHRAAGPALLDECRLLGGCKTGQAKLTKAYNLPCEYIIHTVGPVWNGGEKDEAVLLANCYYNSMTLAVEKGIRTIAFPSISTGIYHFPVQLAARIAVGTVARFVEENTGKIDMIEWVLFDDNTYAVYEEEVDKYYQMMG